MAKPGKKILDDVTARWLEDLHARQQTVDAAAMEHTRLAPATDVTVGDVGTGLGAGFVPGAGVADALGQLPGMDGHNMPSLTQNVMAGNWIDALTQGIGAAGDVAMLAGAVPIGVALKAPRAARVTVAKELENFGKKAIREANRAKRQVGQATAETAIVRQRGAGKRAKVDPDTYRQMYEQEGLPAVLAAGKKGEHLKPNPSGGWVGAPRTVLTGPQLGHMRQQLDRQIAEGAVALKYADALRMGTWYERAKAAQAATNEPYQLPRTLEQHAVYSAGASPENELAFALRHKNADVLGTGETAYRGAPRRKLDSAVAADEPASLAFKIGEYRGKNDPAVQELSPFGVNDFRMAQTFGYTDPQGNPWTAGVSPQMHPVMDMETALAVERANMRAVGGKTDWTGATAQEVPWVYGKAQDLYRRGKNGRFKGGEKGIVAALVDANNTIADYFPKHTLSATHEYTPGADVGHRADILNAPYDIRSQYGQVGRWDIPIAEGALGLPGGSVGAGRRDALYSALGLRQLPAIHSAGSYKNNAGIVESSPLTISRPLVDFENAVQTGNVLAINPPTLASIMAAEKFRGGIDAQEAVAANLPVVAKARKGKDHILLDRGQPPTKDELSAVQKALEGTGIDVSATNRGVLIFTGLADDPKKAMRAAQKLLPDLEKALPGSKGTKSANEGIYEKVSAPKELEGKGVATGRILSAFAKAPEEAALNVSENEAVRRIIRQKIERDRNVPTTREDIQRMREFFASEDWARVVGLIRKGIRPAAAMAAFGYSMQGMAASDLKEAADTYGREK